MPGGNGTSAPAAVTGGRGSRAEGASETLALMQAAAGRRDGAGGADPSPAGLRPSTSPRGGEVKSGGEAVAQQGGPAGQAGPAQQAVPAGGDRLQIAGVEAFLFDDRTGNVGREDVSVAPTVRRTPPGLLEASAGTGAPSHATLVVVMVTGLAGAQVPAGQTLALAATVQGRTVLQKAVKLPLASTPQASAAAGDRAASGSKAVGAATGGSAAAAGAASTTMLGATAGRKEDVVKIPFVVHETGCVPLRLVATLRPAGTGLGRLERLVPFRCD